ncbi:MAG: hypothetical protein A3G09_04520 [Candidatus Moranbacteria bacterium RIFCSPLOWO2_12_FULL_48_12]|nr:MAG: hypothetical protein A3G09_04520 [Candidatus Moranbacteria bacterium RIFCSPLOWO2_12_FULL_48_12]
MAKKIYLLIFFMQNRQKIVIFLIVIAIVGIGSYFVFGNKVARKPIELNNRNQSLTISTEPLNIGEVSPISGLPCENWNRRPLAVMQPGDVTARPAAGFSEADMVIEMPVITSSVTRLMAIYVCNTPTEVGSMRSARHDFISLAKGLDAIFVPWGRSESHSGSDSVGLAQGILNRNEIDNINCNQDAGKSATLCSKNPCFRKEGMARGVDSGYAKPAELFICAQEFGYRLENKFSGYKHVSEAALENRPKGGHLRVAFAGPFAAEYDYDRDTNSYLRTWGNVPDVDRNNKNRNAPKNVIVVMAQSEQIEGQYNNVQLGDPWYDTQDSGDAFYYMNGEQKRGTWKKDKSDINSKLNFFDESGNEVAFVPGQMWVEVLEPGQTLRWEPVL